MTFLEFEDMRIIIPQAMLMVGISLLPLREPETGMESMEKVVVPQGGKPLVARVLLRILPVVAPSVDIFLHHLRLPGVAETTPAFFVWAIMPLIEML